MARNKYIKNALIYLALLLVVVVLMFPLLIVFFTAFKSGTEMTSSLPYALPHSFLYLDNFKTVIQEGSLFRGYANTLFIIAVSLVFNILIGTSAAYILGRFDFKLKKVIMALYFAGIVIPMATTQVATFGIISSLGLFDTPFSLIVLYAGTDIIQLIIYLQFIKNIPFSLDESAMLDGAGYFRIYWSIVFPLMTPAIVTVVILKIVAIYNDVYLPFLYMPDQKLVTVSTSIMRFTQSTGSDYKICSAVALLAIIPILILYIFLQKYIFSGVVAGAIKE